MFEVENNYTREEIAAELGGSAIEYLPRVGGKVVCACLRPDLNPDAPQIILAGFGLQVEESAKALCEQPRKAMPVFVKQQTNAWKYVGDFTFDRFSTEPEEIRKQETLSGRSGRDGISRIIHLKALKK